MMNPVVKTSLRMRRLYSIPSSSCLRDRTAVRSGTESGLLSPRLGISQGAPLSDFLRPPACPLEKVTLPVGLPLFNVRIHNEDVVKVFARAGKRTRNSGSKAQYTIH